MLCTCHYVLHVSVYCAQISILCTCQYTVHMSVYCVYASTLCTCQYTVHKSVHCAHVSTLCTCQYTVQMSVYCAQVSIMCTCQYTVPMPVYCAHINMLCTSQCWRLIKNTGPHTMAARHTQCRAHSKTLRNHMHKELPGNSPGSTKVDCRLQSECHCIKQMSFNARLVMSGINQYYQVLSNLLQFLSQIRSNITVLSSVSCSKQKLLGTVNCRVSREVPHSPGVLYRQICTFIWCVLVTARVWYIFRL
jgi:hypothetical protein